MPLTHKGQSIMRSMEKTYPSKKKAEEVFYASRNAGKITGVDATEPDYVKSYMDAARRGDSAAMGRARDRMRHRR
jgi:hypothetical protein